MNLILPVAVLCITLICIYKYLRGYGVRFRYDPKVVNNDYVMFWFLWPPEKHTSGLSRILMLFLTLFLIVGTVVLFLVFGVRNQ